MPKATLKKSSCPAGVPMMSSRGAESLYFFNIFVFCVELIPEQCSKLSFFWGLYTLQVHRLKP